MPFGGDELKEILNVQELADYLKMNPRTLQRKASKGEIPAIRLDRQYRFDKEQIDTWLSHKAVAKPLNILVVDDDPAIGRLFTQRLERFGHNIITSTNGVEALEFVNRKRFDLIFLDLLMPVIDGAELFVRIREIDKQVTMSIITDEVDTNLLKRAMKKGPVLIMHKPLDGDDVLEALNGFARSVEVKT
jgi:excisionase family DNA binding protein